VDHSEETTDIDYINCIGTGTQNIIAESTAIKRLFDPLYQNEFHQIIYRAYLGEPVAGWKPLFSVLAIREKMIFPNLRLQTP